MNIHAKLSTVNEAIYDLKETQEKILRKLQMNSGDTVSFHVKRHFEKIEVILSELEDKCGKHNTALQEVNNKVVSLVEKVGDISTDIKYLQLYTINRKLLDVKLDKTTCQGDNLQNTTTITPIEQCKIKENSPKPNEDIEELCEDGVSVESIEPSYSHFEVGISNRSSAVQAHPYGRQNEFDNKENLSSEKSQTNRGTNDTVNKDNSSSEEIKVDITNDPEYTDKMSSEDTQKGDFDNKHLLSSDETQQFENTNVSQGTDVIYQRKQRFESVQIDINKNHGQGFAGKTPNETDSNVTDRRNRTELKDKSSSMSVNTFCRNDLGYKRKRSIMSSDNRVAYQSTVFQGNDTKSAVQLAQEPIVYPNIKVKSSLAGRKPEKKEVSPMRKKVIEDEPYGLNPDNISQPRNIREWLAFSEQLRINSLFKLQSGKIQRGSHGHDVTLVLDCSEHMRGQKFTTMIMAAKKYVNGIKQVRMTRLLEDNIGLAVFGGTSGLIVESTSNYDLVLEQIYKLRPEGEAPLVGGFLMGLAGVLGIGATSQILETEVPGYMIVFTDGMSGNTSTAIENEFDIDPLYLTGDFHKQAEISSVISQIANHSIKIFYVPIGQNSSNKLMEKAVRETRGKIIPLNELHRLIKMTQVLILAAQVASDLKHTNPNPTADDVRSSILQRTSNIDDADDDCVDLVLEFIDPLCTERNRGKYHELKCRTLQLGDRVRRGPAWSFGEQDSHLAGTVVGQEPGLKSIWVEWDSGDLNVYIYDERNNNYSIQKVQEPRVLFDEMVAVGCKVTRGNDWTYDNADGGPGSVGTVLRVQQDGSVLVRWDSKKTVEYKMGMDGLFEIQLCNDSSNSKPAYKADINTNKYQSADSSIFDSTASKEKKTRSSDKNIQLPWLVDDDLFHCMLSQGTYLSYENRLSLGGPCRAGKSTLASVLIGEEIPSKWNSTDGLVIYFGRNGIDIENRKMIPLQDGKLGHEVFAKMLRGEPNVEKESNQIIRPETQTSVSNVRSKAHTVLTSESPTNFTQDDNETKNYSTDPLATSISKSDLDDRITLILNDTMPPATTDVQTLDCKKLQLQSDILEEVRNGQFRIQIAPSDIVDFGGQPTYDMTHQLFIQHRGSFLLMFDGRFGLHEQIEDSREGVTAATTLKHWVDSVLTYTEDTEDIMPMVLFAATHRDKCKGDIAMRRAHFIQDIKAMFSNHEKRGHMHLDTVYFINGTDKNDPEIQLMTDQIVQFAMQQSSWGQRRPMQWVPLELQISKMRMENMNIITLEDIHSINKLNADLALKEDQLNDFLLVQHSLGKLMYYNIPGLDKCIIIHPPALVNILRSFVTVEEFFPADKNLKSILQTLTQTGKISQTDLFQLWQQDHLHQYLKDDSMKIFVMKLLVHLDILIIPKTFEESSANVYLVPCMIKTIRPDFKNLQRFQERTICLEYSFNKKSIPSALAYKVIGAAIINWPLKEESGKPNTPCLYHQAAVLNVSEDDELRIWFENNRVMVKLTNKNSLLSISPDVAASIQECLTMNIKSSLQFYLSSFGTTIKPTDVYELYTLALGFPCGNGVCFISAEEVKQTNYWTCGRDKKHETKYLLYWIFDKSQTRCTEGCKGLSNDELKQEPRDKHLVRLGYQIGITDFPGFYINLGMTRREWENTSNMYTGHSNEGIMSMALFKWKKSKLLHAEDPTLKDLSDALKKVKLDSHVICQVFREEIKVRDIGIDDFNLQKIPSDGVLKELSNRVGNYALQLGIELGVSFHEVENSLFKCPKDLPGLVEDILKKWKAESKIKTFKRLMLALQRVDGGGVDYLQSMLKTPYQ